MNRGVLIVSNRPLSALEAVFHAARGQKLGMNIVVVKPVGASPERIKFLTDVGILWSDHFAALRGEK